MNTKTDKDIEIEKLKLKQKFLNVKIKIAAYQAFLRGIINTNLLKEAKRVIPDDYFEILEKELNHNPSLTGSLESGNETFESDVS